MYSPRQKILWFALLSRAGIIILQAVSNFFIPDHNAHVFISPEDPNLSYNLGDKLVDVFIGGFKRWDAQYFIHIAQYGYTYEHCLAFFPLFPLCVRYLALLLDSIFGSLLNYHSLLLISSTFINILCFVKSADVLHKLSSRVLKSESRAYKAAILYCVNPASIFFTAPYSESMFAWMTFFTMYKCTEIETLRFTNIDITSSVPTSFSIVTRSNGLVNLGFIIYTSIKNIVGYTLPEVINKYRTLKSKFLVPFLLLPPLVSVMALFLSVMISLIPYALVQVYNYYKYCYPHEHNLPIFLIADEFVMPGEAFSPWCNQSIPISYSYIQSHYWDVGFLKYYRLKQIPNFILASPVLVLYLYTCVSYIKYNLKFCLHLGLNQTYQVKSVHRYRSSSEIVCQPALFVYIVHALFLSLFCMFFVHIQVSTRLLASSSPLLYWVCSYMISLGPTPSSDQNTINEHFRKLGTNKRVPTHHLSIANLEGVDSMYSKWRTFIISKRFADPKSQFVQLYFLGYFVIGTVCFSNFLPWT